MRKVHAGSRFSIAAVLRACAPRLVLITLLTAAGWCLAHGQTKPATDPRPPAGGVASQPDALMVYLARGSAGACGENCSEWIAAEGAVYWDSPRRMIAALDRFGDRKRTVFVSTNGRSDFNAASRIGRVLRERGFDVGVGQTNVDRCQGTGDAACVALKRAGSVSNASLVPPMICDLGCVLILAGGVRRTVPESTKVVIHGWQIGSRLGLNVSDQHRAGLQTHFVEQYKVYLAQMGIAPEFAAMIEANYGASRVTELAPADLVRLRIVTPR